MNFTRKAHSRCNAPRGYTLLEVLVVVSISSVLLSLIGATLVGVQRASRNAAEGLAQQQRLDRLAAFWRDDVHAARSVQTDPDKGAEESERQQAAARLVLAQGEFIEYSFDTGAVSRKHFRGDEIVARDAFPLEHAAAVEFDFDAHSKLATMRLLFAPQKQTTDSTLGQACIVEAVAGWDLRFAPEVDQ